MVFLYFVEMLPSVDAFVDVLKLCESRAPVVLSTILHIYLYIDI